MASQAGAAEESKPLVKLTAYFTKIPSISDEEFHTYWSESHGPLFSSLPIVKEKLVKYAQYHSSPVMVSTVAGFGLPTLEFDGAAQFYGKDLESVLSVFADPEYVKTVVPDEQKFLDRQSTKFMVGYELLKVNNV